LEERLFIEASLCCGAGCLIEVLMRHAPVAPLLPSSELLLQVHKLHVLLLETHPHEALAMLLIEGLLYPELPGVSVL
jgi:hypothetical protein